jgi:hypothetical protein
MPRPQPVTRQRQQHTPPTHAVTPGGCRGYTANRSRSASSPDQPLNLVRPGKTWLVATAALAREGLRVRLVERPHFPRYYIGESLTPFWRTVLDAIGITTALHTHGFVLKYGRAIRWDVNAWARLTINRRFLSYRAPEIRKHCPEIRHWLDFSGAARTNCKSRIPHLMIGKEPRIASGRWTHPITHGRRCDVSVDWRAGE